MPNPTNRLKSNVPIGMQQAPRWLLHKDKKPFYADGTLRRGELDSPEDLAKFATFEDALNAYESGKYSGLGFALGPDGTGGYWQGIDLDKIEENNLDEIADKLPGYVEWSPSGKGVHAIGYGKPFNTLGSNDSGIEVYSKSRYFTVTGEKISDSGICDLAAFIERELLSLHGESSTLSTDDDSFDALENTLTKRQFKELKKALKYLNSDNYHTWITVGHALKKLGKVGWKLWRKWSIQSEKFNINEAQKKWNGFEPGRTNFRSIFKKAYENGWDGDGGDLPTIVITSDSLVDNFDKAVRILAEHNPPVLYRMGIDLVEVHIATKPNVVDGVKTPANTTIITEVKRGGLVLNLAMVAKWMRKFKKGKKPTHPCQKVVAALLESPSKWGAIPYLNSITEVQIIKPDGSIHDTVGYDCETGIYYDGTAPALNIPEYPNIDDAKESLKTIRRAFAEFPFVDPDLDFAVVLAHMLTLARRAQLPTAPMFAFSATTPGTGKTLLVNVVSLIVRGKLPSTIAPTEKNSSADEERKRITSLLKYGITCVNYDNFQTPVGSESLDALLTAPEWTDRELGGNKISTLPNKLTIAATGNNLTLKGDLHRRSLITLLDANCENPELRTFSIQKLEDYVIKHRGELLAALFTILRAYILAGKPLDNQPSLGSFELWSKMVAAPIQWLGLPNPVKSQKRLHAENAELTTLSKLQKAWFRLRDDDGFFMESWMSVSDLLNRRIFENELDEAIAAIIPSEGSSRSLGRYISKYEGRIVDDLVIRKKPISEKSKASGMYRVEMTNDVDELDS